MVLCVSTEEVIYKGFRSWYFHYLQKKIEHDWFEVVIALMIVQRIFISFKGHESNERIKTKLTKLCKRLNIFEVDFWYQVECLRETQFRPRLINILWIFNVFFVYNTIMCFFHSLIWWDLISSITYTSNYLKMVFSFTKKDIARLIWSRDCPHDNSEDFYAI